MKTETVRFLVLVLCFFGVPMSAGAQSPSVDTSSTQASSPEVSADFEEVWEKLSTAFRKKMEQGGHIGGTVWVAGDGAVRGKAHYGFADLASGRRIDDETIYHWASVTKTVTAIAIMQLRDRGLLSLDDPVVNYLPSLQKVHNPYGPMDDITIRMLLSHTAGFRSPTWPWAGEEEWHPHEPTRWSQLVAMMPYTEIHFEPGTQVKYSNPGYIFLGQIIEQVTGGEYETYVDKNVFTPLRMDRSYFDITPRHLIAYRSNNYNVTAEDTVANGLDFNTGITVANGGLNAPVRDMLRYASFLTGTCTWEACEEVLARSSLREIWAPAGPQSPADADSSTAEENEWEGYTGLSFFGLQREDTTVVYHTGGQKAFTTLFMVEPKAEVSAVVALNSEVDTEDSAGPSASALLREMQKRLVTQVFSLFR